MPRLLFITTLTLIILTAIAGQMNLLPSGQLVPQANQPTAYAINMAAILLTLICLPIAYRLRKTLWAYPLILLPALAGLILHQLAQENTGLLLAAISTAILLLCWPEKK